MPQLAVIINGGGDNKSPKSGGRKILDRGDGRRNNRCVSGSAMVRVEAWWRQGPRQMLEVTQYYYLLYLPVPGGGGGGCNLPVVVAEAKREVGTNIEEVK